MGADSGLKAGAYPKAIEWREMQMRGAPSVDLLIYFNTVSSAQAHEFCSMLFPAGY